MRAGTAWLVVAGIVTEAGCAWIWVLSPRLTAGYNADYTRAFFDRVPLGSVIDGVFGSAQPWSVMDMVAGLEVGLLLMSAGYVLGLWTFGGAGNGAGRVVLGFGLLFRVTMASLPGLFSTDVYSYVMYGRIVGVYGQNPYVSTPNDFPADPFLAWVFPFWRDQPSVYGPLWTDASWLLSRLTGELSNFDQVLAYRLFLIGCELITLGLLWRLIGLRLDNADGATGRARAWAMYAWNPLVLFDLVGNAHNDVAMLVLLVLGLAIQGGRNRATSERWHAGGSSAERWHAGVSGAERWLEALVSITLSALVKFATGVVALVWSVAYAAGGASWVHRLRRLAASWGVGLALAAILWWPWLGAAQAFVPFADAAGGRLVINSAPDLVALFVADNVLVPLGVAQPEAQAEVRFWMRVLTRAVYAGYVLWELKKLWPVAARGGQPAWRATTEAATRALLVLPLLVLTWVWSWYLSWSLILAVTLGWQSRLARVVVAYTLASLPGGLRPPVSERRPTRRLRAADGPGAAGRRLLWQPATDRATAACTRRRAIARLIRDQLHGLLAHGPSGGNPVQDLGRRRL